MRNNSKSNMPVMIGVALAIGVVATGGAAWRAMAVRPRAQAKILSTAVVSAPSDEALVSIGVPAKPSASDVGIARWSAAARARPADSGAWVHLGDAYMQKARETFDLSYYGRAEAVYNRALAADPGKADAMVGLAWVNSGRHEFETSVTWAEKALAIDPKNNEAVGLIGDADVEMGDYDEAFAQYQKMLDLRPDISSYSRGAHLLHLTGNTRKAMWLMLKAIKTGGTYAENTAWCRAQLGLILFSEGACMPAEQVLDEGLKSTPHNYSLLAALGKVKAARHKFSEAIECYRKAIEIAPQLDSVVALGDLYTATGKPDLASTQYALVAKIHQLSKANGVRGDMQIAQFYADHDLNLAEALRMAEEEYKTRKNVYAADTLAWCRYKCGRIQEAKTAIDEALRRKTPEALFLFHNGMIYAKSGQESQARIALYECLSQNAHFHPLFAKVAEAAARDLGSRPADQSASAGPNLALHAPAH